MPTELPIRRSAPPEGTPRGNLFFLAAVMAMLVVSTVLLMHPDAIAGVP